MPKLFDEFDLDLQKIKNGIQTRDSDDGTLGGDCTSGGAGSSLCGISTWTTNCTDTCLFCKK